MYTQPGQGLVTVHRQFPCRLPVFGLTPFTEAYRLLGVRFMTPFQMLRTEGARFVLGARG